MLNKRFNGRCTRRESPIGDSSLQYSANVSNRSAISDSLGHPTDAAPFEDQRFDPNISDPDNAAHQPFLVHTERLNQQHSQYCDANRRFLDATDATSTDLIDRRVRFRDFLNGQFSDSSLTTTAVQTSITAIPLPYAPSAHSFHFLAVVKQSLLH